MSSYEGGYSHGYTLRYQGRYLRAFLALGPSRVTIDATPRIQIKKLASRMKFWMLPYPRHRGSLPYGRYLLAPLNGNKEGCKCLMVLRVKPTLIRFPTNSFHTPMDNTPLHSITNVCHSWVCSQRTEGGKKVTVLQKRRFAGTLY